MVRTVAAILSGIPEHKIHVISPDIGGGFGNKVGVYPGYVCSVVASIVTGRPVKWVEDRIENLSATSFARDYHMTTEIAATKAGKVTALRVHALADHGAFDACADPSKWPAGFFNIVTGSYDFPTAHCVVDGVYTNKAPGGVAYRCSFRVTEAAYCIERGMDILAAKLGMDPAELRLKNFVRREQFPYQSALGWEYDSGDYHTAMRQAMEKTGYAALRAEQKAKQEAFRRGETREADGHRRRPSSPRSSAPGHPRTATSSASRCSTVAKSASTRPAPRSRAWGPKARARGTKPPTPRSSRPRSAFPPMTSWSRKAIPTRRRTALGTYGSRSTPVAGAAIATAARKIKAKAQMIAAYMMEVHHDDVEFDIDRFRVKGLPEKFKTMKEIAWAAYNAVPPGLEPGLEAVSYYDPPNMTYPFGAYICVMDIDVDTGRRQDPPLLRAG